MQNQPDILTGESALEPDHMKEIILRYVQEESSNPYALMITGDWGSGKTYYLKNVIKKEIKDKTEKELLYITLNGVTTFSEVSEQLLSELWKPAKFVKENRIARISWRLLKSGLNVLTRAARIPTNSNSLNPIEIEPNDLPSVTTQEFFDFSKKVIVFDDLERISSKIETAEILGFINSNFVEHDHIKVIIVCNEEEIHDEDFGKIKEKMIGRTLEFKNRTIEMATAFIEDNEGKLDKLYKSFLEINKKFILNRIKQAEITNLRTLFFFFDSLATIISALDADLKDLFGEEIIHQTLLFSNEFKDGRLEKYSSDEKLPGFFSFSWGSPVLFRGNEKEDKDEKDFRRKYTLEDRPSTPLLMEIHYFVRFGYLDTSSLNSKFRKRLDGEHTPEVNALLKLHPTNFHKLTNEVDFVARLEIQKSVR